MVSIETLARWTEDWHDTFEMVQAPIPTQAAVDKAAAWLGLTLTSQVLARCRPSLERRPYGLHFSPSGARSD